MLLPQHARHRFRDGHRPAHWVPRQQRKHLRHDDRQLQSAAQSLQRRRASSTRCLCRIQQGGRQAAADKVIRHRAHKAGRCERVGCTQQGACSRAAVRVGAAEAALQRTYVHVCGDCRQIK